MYILTDSSIYTYTYSMLYIYVFITTAHHVPQVQQLPYSHSDCIRGGHIVLLLHYYAHFTTVKSDH